MRRRGRTNQSSMMAISVAGTASHASMVINCDSMSGSFASDLQHRQERLLWNLHLSELLHAFLAFFLLLEQLALAADVPAVALGQHVLTQCLDRGARNNMTADGCLHRDLEHLARNQLLHFIHQVASARVGVVSMHDH